MSTFPLVVDLDGTLTATDTLIESLVLLIRREPLTIFLLPFWLLSGRAGLKERVSQRVTLAADSLPLTAALVDHIRTQKGAGRLIVLATAANRRIADAFAARLGLFDRVIASDEHNNLKGERKLEAIRAEVGNDFCYAGDSSADLPIWRAAKGAILVGTSSSVTHEVRSHTPIELHIERPAASLKQWLKQLRVHQWSKNILLFVPLLTAFAFTDLQKVAHAVLAFFAFSFTASATYIVNDILDLESDRAHPRKKNRPLASGVIPIERGLMVSAVLMVAAVALALQVNLHFFAILMAYLVLTSLYSWYLKVFVMLDVMILAGLFTLRIFAGSMATDIEVSKWLLAFSIFIFLSLALVKRCAELVVMQREGRSVTRGRDYRVDDLVVLWPTGVGAGLASIVVFGLFVSAPEVQARYGAPELMWFIGFGLIYWLSRLWIKTARGEMHDDPLVYALMNVTSRLTILAMVGVVLAARFLHWS